MTDKDTSDVWWRNVICYSLDVATFADSDGDGWGDLVGLTDRLGYLRQLGVGCLWLLPVHPSPRRDDGYDVADHFGVDSRLGSPGDFVEMVRTAHSLGLKVVLDLVVSHTSDEHPWFVESRSSRESPKRDYYIWARERPDDWHDPVFPGEQDSTWTLDEGTGEWYFHHYHSFQPDLNVANPKVRDEINKIVGYWLELGVDGFRVDSLPFIIDKPLVAESVGEGEDPHTYLRQLRDFLTRRRGDAVLLGEANIPKDEQRRFFGDPRILHDDSEAHLLFDFGMQAALWLALARQDAGPIVRALADRPALPENCCYASFVRHHDELTFEIVLSRSEADEIREAFDPEGAGEIYGRGLRRRLASLVDGDIARSRLLIAVAMSLPGMPGILYGDEIGLRDDLSLPGRRANRVPMRWWPARDGAPTGSAMSLEWDDDASTLVAQVRRLMELRRDCTEIGYGEVTVLPTDDRAVLALHAEWQERSVVVAHNLSEHDVTLVLPGLDGDGVVVLEGRENVDGGKLRLGPWQSIWFRPEPG